MKKMTIQEENALCQPFQILSVSEPQQDKNGNNFKTVSVVPIDQSLLGLGFALHEIMSGRKPINVAIFEEDGHWYDAIDDAKAISGEDIRENTDFLFTVLDENGKHYVFPDTYGLTSLRGKPVVTNNIRTFRFKDQPRNATIAKALLRARVNQIESAQVEMYKEYMEMFLSTGKVTPPAEDETVI